MFRKILITAGSTTVPIDQVRAITNIFYGRTGTEIAKHYAEQGDEITLITSKADLLDGYHKAPIRVVPYRTFDQLKDTMGAEIAAHRYDIVIHSAAVSDYRVDGVYVETGGKLQALDKSKKVSSKHDNLFLRLIPTLKIVDLIRREWNFRGLLVKFKLEVGLSDEELIAVAARSLKDSQADYIIANCLEWMGSRAFIIDKNGNRWKTARRNLPSEMHRRIT